MLTFALVVAASAAAAGDDLTLATAGEATPEEMRAYAEQALASQAQDAVDVDDVDKKVRRSSGRADGLPCVSAAINVTNSLLEVSEAAKAELEASLADGANARAVTALRKLIVARSQSSVTATEAAECAFGVVVEEGESVNKTEAALGDGEADTKATNLDPTSVGFDEPDDASVF